jgi:hypothetical protein
MFCDNLFKIVTLIDAKYIIYIENNIFYDVDIDNVTIKLLYIK